jgi:hypothetical protein
MSTGKTTEEASRRPRGRNLAAEGRGFAREADKEYVRVPRVDPALRGDPNPQDEDAFKLRGFETISEDVAVTGHPKMVLMARPLDHPRAVQERKEKKAQEARERPQRGRSKPLKHEVAAGAIVEEADRGFSLGEVGSSLPSRDELEREAAQSEEILEDNPEYARRIERIAMMEEADE